MGVPLTVVDPALPTVVAPAVGRRDGVRPAPRAPAAELERQVTAYVELGVAALLGLDEAGFRALVAPARTPCRPHPTRPRRPTPDDAVPFVLVVPVPDVNDLVPAMRRGSEARRERDRPRRGADVPPAARPRSPAARPRTCCAGIDTGSEFCNVRPEDALRTVAGARSHPADHRRGRRAGRRAAGHAAAEPVLLAHGLAHGDQPAGARGVDQRAPGQARLVLGPQPAHVARRRVGDRSAATPDQPGASEWTAAEAAPVPNRLPFGR